MKKTIAWFLILATLLLAGCQRVVDPSNPTSGGPGISADPTNTPTDPNPTDPIETKPTEPAPTDPIETQPTEPLPTDPAPTDPAPTEPEGFPANMNTDEKVVQKFQKLFDNGSWFTQALTCTFDEAANVRLEDFLMCSGKPWDVAPATEAEVEALVAMTGHENYWDVDCYSIKADLADEILRVVFGLSMDQISKNARNYLVYMESTDSYYYGRTDSSLVWDVSVAGIRQLENGNIEVYYTCEWLYPEEGVVTLKPVGDSYIVISNKRL